MGSRSTDSTPAWANRLCIILVRPFHEGNIGAVARCMMNFGITDLRIVGRNEDLTDVARKRAKHANSILEKISFYDGLKSSISDNSYPAKTPSGQIKSVNLLLSGSLYLINFSNFSSISLIDKLYFNLKFGEITFI